MNVIMPWTNKVREFGSIVNRYESYRKILAERDIRFRLLQKDASIWLDIIEPPESGSHCMDWTDSLRRSLPIVTEVSRLSGDSGTLVLIGTGGAILSAKAYSSVLGYEASTRLQIVDSPSPEFLRAFLEDPASPNKFYVIASKSGGTVETLDIARSLFERVRTPDRFCVITDPESNALRIWAEANAISVYSSDPFVPGRYSAVSTLGLLPLILLGHELQEIQSGYDEFVEDSSNNESSVSVHADETAAILATLASESSSRVLLAAELQLLPILQWVEQIVSESLGKSELGILPVIELFQSEESPGNRLQVRAISENTEVCSIFDNELNDLRQTAQFFMFWQTVISMTGYLLNINPFNQPNVEGSKRKVLTALRMKDKKTEFIQDPVKAVTVTAESANAIRSILQHIRENSQTHDYICLLAFTKPGSEMLDLLTRLKVRSGEVTGLTAVLNFGPQYLHSTGQFHKGGPRTGHYLIIGFEENVDFAVCDRPYTFGELVNTQLYVDLKVLRQSGRPVHHIELKQPVAGNLREILELL